jgi:predicted phage terminase large subunit-like protein
MEWGQIIRAKPFVAENLRKDLGAFSRAAWPHLHRGTKLSWTPAHDLICEHLLMVHQKRILRLIINCPPRFAKSSIVTILFPIWCWLQNPTLAFLCCSYEIDLATNHNQDRRRLMETEWFKGLFGDRFQLATDRSQAGEFGNTAGGIMQAASTNSKAQGRGGDVLVVDDPLSADQTYSDALRTETNLWFTNQLPQRLNDPANSAIVVVAQRLHQNDPCGFLLAQEDSEWTLLKLPLICEEPQTLTFPVSGRIWTRKKGDCLDPKRFPPRVVRERQRDRLVWAGQFQQEPMDPAGNLIRTDDIMFFGGRDPKTGALDPGLPEHFDRKIISVDCSFKDRPKNDYVAIIVVGIVGSRRYLLHVSNAHLDLTGTENEIRNCHAAYGPIAAVLIEDKANGSAVISRLTEQIPGVIAVNPEGGKMTRVAATSPEFQAHNWIIERNGPWAHKVIEQLTMFPNAKNDDVLDAIAQASIWLQRNASDTDGLIEWYRRKFSGYYDKARKIRHGTEPAAETGVESSCMHCGNSTNLEICGTGESTRVHCRICGGYTWAGYTASKRPNTPCPACGRTCTVVLSNGSGGTRLHCNQCAADDGVKPANDSETCPKGGLHLWRIVPGGQKKCEQCEVQRWIGPRPTTNGMSRAEYAGRSGDLFERQFCRLLR